MDKHRTELSKQTIFAAAQSMSQSKHPRQRHVPKLSYFRNGGCTTGVLLQTGGRVCGFIYLLHCVSLGHIFTEDSSSQYWPKISLE